MGKWRGGLLTFLPRKGGGAVGSIRERGLNRLIGDLQYKDQKKKFPAKQGSLMKCLEVSTEVAAFSLYDE